MIRYDMKKEGRRERRKKGVSTNAFWDLELGKQAPKLTKHSESFKRR